MRDIRLSKEMGFNGASKHHKIEAPQIPVSCGPHGIFGLDGGGPPGLQPPVHRGLGAAQRVLRSRCGYVQPGGASPLTGHVLSDGITVRGFVYTQLCDVEQETNGLLTYGRRPKIPLEVIRRINEGGSESND